MMNAIAPLTVEQTASSGFLSLLWEAAGVDSDALLWIRDVELPRMRMLGALDDAGDVVGFAAFDASASHAELHYLAVAESARGRGVGTHLVEAVRRDVAALSLHAGTDDDAVEFYRALGFAVAPAARDSRWPTRERYLCTIPPLDASV